MEPWLIILIIFVSILLLTFLTFILPFYIIAVKVYKKQLVRKNKEMWGRACSAPDNAEQVEMYRIGEEWGMENKEYIQEVELESYDGLHLVGQFFDFGHKKCAIIHQGRTESLLYTYYFAKPYQDAGFNILVIDPRAHGLSDGKYSTCGIKEARDLLDWTRFIHDKFHQEEIYYHGICIGSATCLYAITDKSCPPYVLGLTADGMFKSFHATMKTHMKAEGAPMSSFLAFLVMIAIYFHTGANQLRIKPEARIKKLKKPILMIHSKEDIFSLPKYASYLYDLCKSDKKLVWFDKGAHSHIRINNQERYDEEIKTFLKERNL